MYSSREKERWARRTSQPNWQKCHTTRHLSRRSFGAYTVNEKKSYKHLFVVRDAVTKFIWLLQTKSTTCKEPIKGLRWQVAIFGTPKRIVADRGTASTFNAFREYCKNERILLQFITTDVLRSNGQVERMNKMLIPILTKQPILNLFE